MLYIDLQILVHNFKTSSINKRMNSDYGMLGQFEEGPAHLVGPTGQGAMPEVSMVGF